MRIPKFTVVVFGILVGLTILFIFLPDYQIKSIEINAADNPEIPYYKFDEAIQLWKIWKVTIFQPASLILIIVTIIVAVIMIAQLIAINYKLAAKDEIQTL